MHDFKIADSRNGNVIASDPTKIEALKTLASNSEFKDIAKEAESLSADSKPTQVGAVFNKLFEKTLDKSKSALETELMTKGATKYGTNSASGLAMRILKTATTPKSKGSTMAEGMLSANSIAGGTYKAFVNEGKFGGSEVLTLNEILTSPSRQNVMQSIFGSNITVNDQGTLVPVSADGQGAATGPVMLGSVKGIPGAARSGNIKTIAEAYGERVAEYLKKTKKITIGQEKFVSKVGKALGLEIEFVDKIANGADGEITGNRVVISRYAKNPIKFVFKHEFTHSLESSKLYKDFSRYVTNESAAFKHWLEMHEFDSVHQAIKETQERYASHGETLEYTEAKMEVIADFVGDMLFNDGQSIASEIDESFLSELARADRNLFERFVDWIESVIARLRAANAVERDIVKLEQMVKRLKETRETAKVDSTTKNSYNQFRTEAMIWAYSAGTKPGDTKIFSRNGETFVLLEATENGCIEIANGEYKEMKKVEQQYREPDNSIYVYSKIVRNAKGRHIADYNNVENGRQYERGSRPTRSQGLQTDTAGNNEHLRRSNKESSKGKADSIDGSASSIPKSKHSYAGERALTANRLELSTAKQMLKDGEDSETIRKLTGWFKGMDGKWRFEISDDKIDVKESFYTQNAAEFNKILMKVAVGLPTTPEETQKYNTWVTEYSEFFYGTTLGEFIEHTDLFKAYPEIKDINVRILPLPARDGGKVYAKFSRKENSLVLNSEMFAEGADPDHEILKYVLVHETQHIIQTIEGFARGSSSVYWQARMQDGEVFKDKDGNILTPKELYERTAGEIESNDVSARIDLNDAQRKKIRPDIDRTDVVFADKELEMDEDEKASLAIPSDHTFVYRNGKASFTENRLSSLLDEHSLGEGKRAEYSNAYVGYISPDDFINLTSNEDIRGRVEDDAYVLNEDELRQETETPFLEYDPETNEVVNHEGRHRMVALKADGVSSVAVVVKPSNDSFERREPQDISLTGQDFAGGRANGEVTLKNAIPLSEKYRTEATAKFAANPDADVRYSIPGDRSIKEQLNQSSSLLNEMDIIASLNEEKVFESKQEVAEWALSRFASTNFIIERKGFGEIILDKKRIKKGLSYLKTNEERLALALVPDILKNGIKIDSHPKHKGRLYDTFTFAGPVEINKQRGNMAVVVRQESKNYYKVHRLLLPDGSQFVLDKKGDIAETAGGIDNNSGLSPTDNVSKHSISNSSKNVKYSIPTNAIGKSREELKAMVENGEITLDEAFESLTDQYGALPRGENPKVDVTFPQKISKNQNVSRFARTAAESGHLAEGMSEAQQMEILKGGQTYQVISDDAALSRADNTIKNDFAGAVEHWQDIINSGKQMNKYDIALGERLFQQAAENGHTSDTMKYIAELAELGTRMGQNVQALSLLKKMTGIGKLYYVQRAVDSLNRDIEQKYNGKKEPVKINTDLAEMLAKSKSQKDAEAISDDIEAQNQPESEV